MVICILVYNFIHVVKRLYPTPDLTNKVYTNVDPVLGYTADQILAGE